MLRSPSLAAYRLCSLALMLALALGDSQLAAQVEFGIGGGLTRYEGDLAPQGAGALTRQNRPSVGAFVRLPIGSRLAARAFYQQGRIGATDAERNSSTRSRNLSFESPIRELGALLEVHPLGHGRVVSPFLFGGASVYRFDPRTEYLGQTVRLQPLGTEGQGRAGFDPRYRLTRFAVPLGGGVRVGLGSNLSLGIEAGARLTFFDHLDDVSGDYVAPSLLSDGEGGLAPALADRGAELPGGSPATTRAGSPRGDAADNDWFYVGHVTLGWRFGRGALKGAWRQRGAPHVRCYRF